MAKSSWHVDISGREHLEQWRPIPNFEGYYEVSNLGRVRSVDRFVNLRSGGKMFLRGAILKQRLLLDRGRYAIVMMSKEGVYQNKSVHRLVLSAFVGPCPPGYECRHLNNIRTDNRLENLAWGTKSENTIDQVRSGTHRNIRKTHCLRGHEFTAENTYLRPSGGRNCRACRVITESRNKMRKAS